MASIIVWREEDRLHLDEPADRVILYLHVGLLKVATAMHGGCNYFAFQVQFIWQGSG